MGADSIADLSAVLRGEGAIPAGEAGDGFMDLARRHRVDRLLAQGASRGTERTEVRLKPDTTGAAALRLDILIDAVRVRELASVVNALDAAGIVPIVFKGAALAHTHYSDSWLRPRLDADLLIADTGRARADDVLDSLGYDRPPVASGDLVSYQAMFVRTDAIGIEHVVDLHWRIANSQLVARALSYAELLDRSDRIAASGIAVRVPSPVDALMLSCIHRAAHHHDAPDLIWIYDIHLIAGRLDADAWARFAWLAADRQVSAICARGLALAQRHFHTPVPREWQQRSAPLRRRPLEPSAVLLRGDLRPVDRLRADLRALHRRQRTRLLREHLFPPASYMRAKYGVRSRTLLPALYAYRMVAGAARWWWPARS
jgi:Uncharacterised nucleotidyltransferase